MDSQNSSSIFQEYKEYLSFNHSSQDTNSINNSKVLNKCSNNPEYEKDCSLIQNLENNQSKSHNTIESIQKKSDINLSSKMYQHEKSKSSILYKIICKNCCNFPLILFNKINKMDLRCNCKSIKDMEYDYFIENYIVKDNLKNISKKILIDNYCFCEIHLKPYSYFCESCSNSLNKISGLNLCEDCLREKNIHSKHEVYFSDYKMNDNISKIAEFIKDKNTNLKTSFSEDSSNEYLNEKITNFLLILKMILICSKKYFCYNIYKTINSTKIFLDSIKNIPNNTYEQNTGRIIISRGEEQSVNIKEKKELINLKDNQYHNKIKLIELMKINLFDISILKNSELINLEILSLINNNIVNIDPIKTMKAVNLKELNLSSNLIPDKYIYVFKEMNFPKLNFVSLARNFLHNFDIFNSFKKCKNLTKIYLGTNKLEKKEIKNIDNINYELPNLEVIGLTLGVFSDITINLISYFNFKKLQKLYISGNNLSSLDFVKKLNCKNLKIFWAFSNNFSNFWPLTELTELNDINLSNNFISDISSLFDFFQKLKNLSKFDLSNNRIEKNDKNSEIIKKIKDLNKPGKRNIKIYL